MNEAKELKIISEAQYPFGKGRYEIKTGTGRKLALTLSEIGAVLKHELKKRYRKTQPGFMVFLIPL